MTFNRNASINKLYPIFFMFLCSFKILKCQTEEDNSFSTCLANPNSLKDERCFNNVLKFENYQLNNLAQNNKGDFIIEFTGKAENVGNPNSRIFYGLTKDENYFFRDESTYTRKFDINYDEGINDENPFIELDSSKNLFVSIKNADSIEIQYLFSINSYNSMVELYDLNNNDNKYHIWSFSEFFNLREGEYLYPFSYEIFEFPQESEYIIVFIPKEIVDPNKSSAPFIIKFIFNSFENASVLKIVNFDNFNNKKILNVFLMDDNNDFVILYVENEGSRRRNSKIIPPGDWLTLRKTNNYKFSLQFYNNEIDRINNIEINFNNFYLMYDGEGLFIKSLYLNNLFVVFLYYNENHDFFNLELFELKDLNLLSSISCKMAKTFQMNNNKYFDVEKSLNDFVKINNNKLAFIFISYSYNYDASGNKIKQISESKEICILIININKDNNNIKEFYSFIDFDEFVPTNSILGFSYNNYLLFSSTTMPQDNSNNVLPDYLSMFMIFGYLNSPDDTIDISELFYDQESELNVNFFDYLTKKTRMENNIYNNNYKAIYFPAIPDEIKIYLHNGEEYIESDGNNVQLESSYTFCFDGIIEDFCSNRYNYGNSFGLIIEQDKELTKNSQYYFIEYQFIIKEIISFPINMNCPDNSASSDGTDNYGNEYNTDISNTDTQTCPQNFIYEDIFYYSRISRLKFKLCHPYCNECKELGTSDDDQKCTSCFPQYHLEDGQCIKDEEIISSSTQIDSTTQEETSQNIQEDLTTDTPAQCDYDCIEAGICNFDNFDNENNDFYEKIKNCEYISKYDGGNPIIIKNSNGYSAQITTLENEINTLQRNIQSNFSIIDLKDCADILRSQEGLNPDDDLIILKYENDNKVSNGYEKSIQYEVYLPNTNTKLDLSLCSETDINIYIPIELSEKTQALYDNLKDQGYNLFDKNDKFYLKFCTIYNSLNGTDVILPDRHNIYQQNKLECQNHCEYSDYSSESKYLKCQCQVTNEEKIETKNPEKITAKSFKKSFYDVLKYSNYKVLYCYNLVFRKVTIKENLGSIISNIYFIGYLISFCILCYTKATYLKKEISKLFENENDVKSNLDINNNNITIFRKNDIIDKQKLEQDEDNNEQINEKKDIEKNGKINEENIENLQNENTIKINIEKKEVEETKINNNIKIENNNIIRNNKIKNDIGHDDENKIYKSRNQPILEITLKDNLSENKNFESKDVLTNKLAIFDQKPYEMISKIPSERESIKSKKDSKKCEKEEKEQKDEKEALSNYELNDLEYDEALELDNRNFLNIYWYLLNREQIILFTFFNWNDFNLFSIKLSKLFLSICSDMAFNVFFFSDESMHKTYETGGEHDWFGQLAQIVYSTIISQLLQTFVNYLTMTDIHYYELKALKKDNKINSKEALSVIKCIKIKIIAYFISTFLMFLFFWYISSAFCAVYPNTQEIFIVDSLTSFLMGLLYPFVLYLIPTTLRVLSLKAKAQKNLKILYSLSDKIPIF